MLNLPFDLKREFAGKIYVLIDGLDELVGVEQGGDRRASHLLERALNCVPKSSRIVVTSRPPAFAMIKSDFMRHLPSASIEISSTPDPFDAAIAFALNLPHDSTLTLQVLPVSLQDAKAYLRNGGIDDSLVAQTAESATLSPFLSNPFMLRLLTLALPRLLRKGAISTPDLYRVYVIAALAREGLTPSAEDREAILHSLCRVASAPLRKVDSNHEKLARKANILTRERGALSFSHHSLWEYFFSLGLLNEITSCDARRLSRLDLVSGYNINRMLIPMIVGALRGNITQGGRLRIVSQHEYDAFVADSKWRATTGYGIHSSNVESKNGTRAASFSYRDGAMRVANRPRNDIQNAARSLSWYDAAAFAHLRGARLPSAVEIVTVETEESLLFWTEDWFDEPVSQIAVLDTRDSSMKGLNPDIRLPQSALAVVS